ncbi:Fibronectin type III domain containing protein 3B, partial [Dissostichus eleginoides]
PVRGHGGGMERWKERGDDYEEARSASSRPSGVPMTLPASDFDYRDAGRERPAEVPMMSPHGSIPPIHVPPGYISQVLEDNTGVRRVVVTPQSPECYPPSYSPALSPTHHLPPYLTHPHFIPNSHSFYPPVSPGDLSPHQYYQHHLPPMYGDPEIIPVYGMSNYIGREETYSKPQPKKIKERQLERQNRLNSPPSPLYKGSLGPAHNGYSNKSHAPSLGSLGSGGGLGSPGGKKPERRLRSSPRN